jgi:hypothetical protein
MLAWGKKRKKEEEKEKEKGFSQGKRLGDHDCTRHR